MPRPVLVAVALVSAAITAYACASTAPPRLDPTTLAQQATIRRDDFGIPHILAQTEEAAALAFGYAQAEDHAEEIGRRYLTARGQAAMHFGRGALEGDLQMSRFDNLAESVRALETISPLYRRLIGAYAAGVNLYVSKNRHTLPAWMPTITAADVLANTRASAVNAIGGAGFIRQLRQKYEGGTAGSGLLGDNDENPWVDQPGSNAFALAGSRTASGKPILLGNPHLSWSSLYWEAHVRVPGKIDFYGSTLAGIPVLRAGFNDRLGFVTTNNAPDLDDVFALTIDPKNADAVLFDGRSIPLVRREAMARVRNEDGSMVDERREYWTSALGPVVYRTPTRAFIAKSTRLDAYSYYEGFYLLSRARSLDEWNREMRKNLVPTSNFTYADADGNILYYWNGRVPVRRDGVDYRLDVEASGKRDIWDRLYDIRDLPRMLNPPGGYVQNANNPPQFVSLRDPLDMGRYPSHFERGPLALRPQLALDMLDRASKLTVADVTRIKYNTRMLLAERVKAPLIEAVRAQDNGSEALRAGADALAEWDGTVSASSRGAVLFQTFWDGYTAAVRQPYATQWSAANPVTTPFGLSDPGEAMKQLEAAVLATRKAYGSERVAWGDVNRFRIGDVDLPGDGAFGTYGTFRVMRFDRVEGVEQRIAGNLPGRDQLIGFGDAWVLLVDFSQPVTGWSVLAYGQTSNLNSRHSRDQIKIFANHELRRAWYTEEEIKSHTTREYRPE
jgi:acyl-homoserine-lactone acylase